MEIWQSSDRNNFAQFFSDIHARIHTCMHTYKHAYIQYIHVYIYLKPYPRKIHTPLAFNCDFTRCIKLLYWVSWYVYVGRYIHAHIHMYARTRIHGVVIHKTSSSFDLKGPDMAADVYINTYIHAYMHASKSAQLLTSESLESISVYVCAGTPVYPPLPLLVYLVVSPMITEYWRVNKPELFPVAAWSPVTILCGWWVL